MAACVGGEIRTPAKAVASLPPLHEWAEARGFDGLGESEFLEYFAEAEQGQAAPDPSLRRRRVRAEHLRWQLVALWSEQEAAASQRVQLDDRLDG